jgi:hypothetical protein
MRESTNIRMNASRMNVRIMTLRLNESSIVLPRLYSDNTGSPVDPGPDWTRGMKWTPAQATINHVRSVHAHEVQAPAGRIARIPIVLYN